MKLILSLVLSFVLSLSQVSSKEELQKGDIEKPRADSRNASVNASLSLTEYHRYDKITNYIDELAKLDSLVISVEIIGQSSEGRDLKVIKFCADGCGIKPVIFIDCGIHAREWLGISMCLYIISELAENADNGNMLMDTNWYIIPVLNPDGYEYTHTHNRLWRKTRSEGKICKGVDPNRNFDYSWNVVGASTDECVEIYSGPTSFSEPETRAFRDFVLKHKDYIKIYISFHTYGQYILHSWGWTTELPDNVEELDALGNDVADAIKAVRGTQYTVGSPATLIYPSGGGSDDWIKGVAGVPLTYVFELPRGEENGFIADPSNIEPVVTETFVGVKVLQSYVAHTYGKE